MSKDAGKTEKEEGWKPLFHAGLEVFETEDEVKPPPEAMEQPFTSLFDTQENLTFEDDDEEFKPFFSQQVKKNEKGFSTTSTKPKDSKPEAVFEKAVTTTPRKKENKKPELNSEENKDQKNEREQPEKPAERAQPPREKKPEPPKGPDPKQIEEIKKKAYEEGFNAGKTDGFEAGKTEGHELGFNTGREDGAKEGFDQGYEEGAKAGYEAGLAEAQGILDRLGAIINESENSWMNFLEQNEPQIIELIKLIVEKLTYKMVEMDGEIVRKTIMHAFQILPDQKEVTIYVNRDDYEFIDTIKEGFFQEFKELKHVSVIPDPAVNPGGCKLETKSGEVDATFEKRLNTVTNSIIDAMGA